MDSTKTLIIGNLFDGKNCNFYHGWLMEENGRICALGQGSPDVQVDANYIDATGKYVLPGLIDGHNHLFLDPGSFESMSQEAPDNMLARMQRNASAHLHNGVTAIRECGTPHYLDVKLKGQINRGEVPGPELLVSGEWITSPRGHGAFPGCAEIVQGEKDIREAVKRIVDGGAEFIKVMVTGGNATKWSPPEKSFFDLAELSALADEAAKHGKKVSAHVHSSEGARNSVLAGIQMIEHGSLITDDETIELIRKHDVIWVFNQHQRIADPDPKMPDYKRKRTLEGRERSKIAVQKAIEAKIRMCTGCDGYHQNSAMVWAMEGMVQSGATDAQALLMGTYTPGMAFFGGKRGVLEVGAHADVIVCGENPLENISTLRQLSLVMKEGVIIKKA